MSHEFIVKWFEVFEDDEFVYMILELCEGKVGPFPPTITDFCRYAQEAQAFD